MEWNGNIGICIPQLMFLKYHQRYFWLKNFFNQFCFTDCGLIRNRVQGVRWSEWLKNSLVRHVKTFLQVPQNIEYARKTVLRDLWPEGSI